MKIRTLLPIAGTLLFSTSLNARDVIPYNSHDGQGELSIADSSRLGELVVTGTRIPVSSDYLPNPLSVIGRETLEQSGESALLPSLSRYVPSLFVTSKGMAGYGVSTGAAGGINLRGLSGGSGRVLILIDGHPQYATIYGHPVADAYIAGDAERVEVTRGGSSILYGSNAMGGALNIITRKMNHSGNKLSARLMAGSYGTQRYQLYDSYRNNKFSALLGGNYERTNGHRERSEFESLSGMAKLSYDIAAAWRAVGNVNVTKFSPQNPGEEINPMYEGEEDVVRGMSGLSIENNYRKTRGALNLFYNWGNHKINDGYTLGGSSRPFLFHSTDYMAGANLYQTVTPFEKTNITAGFDVKLYGGNAYRNPVTEIYADHIKLNEVAGYLFAQQEVGKFMLNGGLRLEHHNLYGNEWVPQFGVTYSLSSATNFKLSASKGFRTPNMRELYMYAAANEELLPERNWSYDFTVTQRLFANRLGIDLTLYYMKGDNLVEVVREGGVPQNRNTGSFIHKGVEFSFNYNVLKDLSIIGNYSYLYMKTPVVGAPKNKFYGSVIYSPGNFTFSAGVQVIDHLYLATGSNEKLSNYNLIDIRGAYRFAKWIEASIKMDNLLCKKYETMLGFPMPRGTVMGGVSITL